jgi:hypothetical protein
MALKVVITIKSAGRILLIGMNIRPRRVVAGDGLLFRSRLVHIMQPVAELVSMGMRQATYVRIGRPHRRA